MLCIAHITHKVLLLAQDGLKSFEFIVKLRDELLQTPLVRRLPTVQLVYLFVGNGG
jgi:hypothetical protein